MKNLLPIGRFSKVCRLTIKALRHYDEIGLLRPALVDPASGYRYYSLAQAADAERIRVLRSLDMPLEEIQEVLRRRDPDAVRESLDRHRLRIEERLAEYQRALAFLQRLMQQEEGIMPYEVKTREMEAQSVLSHRTRTSIKEIGQAFGQALGLIMGYAGRVNARPVGPPLSIYHGPEFDEDNMDIEICLPVDRRLTGDGPVSGRELPGCTVAYTMHAGHYDEIGPAYQALMGWIKDHGHEAAGPPRETYLVGPGQTEDPAAYRTEVAWPIG